eukprot:m.129522 g.129522  ORF g.129522 m.129522 type:complete len:100 (-) comp52315_c0_seq7:334-633(-)
MLPKGAGGIEYPVRFVLRAITASDTLQENERVVITLTISRCGGCSPLEIGLDVKAGFLSRGRWAREAEVKREWVVGDVAAAAFAMRLPGQIPRSWTAAR